MAIGIQVPYIDGDFTHAVETDGGPIITTDETTKSLSITRFYAVRTANYRPLSLGASYNQTQQDKQYTNAYLLTESVTQVIGPITYFQRVFATVPDSRTEPRSIAFTMPGQSAVQRSSISNQPIGWDPYGKARPYTRILNAEVEYSYSINGAFFYPPLTRITFAGTPVDYVGLVYQFAGYVQVTLPNNAGLTTEPRWTLAGATDPALIPAIWVQEFNVTRWRGPIWQAEKISLNPLQLG